MAAMGDWNVLSLTLVFLVFAPSGVRAFGPGLTGDTDHYWCHGDIESTTLVTIGCLAGKAWTPELIKRAYFGNWLRDYAQLIDYSTLQHADKDTYRLVIWVLSLLVFGRSTKQFEPTEEKLGCYRPEEHLHNPLRYAPGVDARKQDRRLRGPVTPSETAIDPRTGLKNYIANESGGWATSAGYIRFSMARSIHFGRLYTSGSGSRSGRSEDLDEAMRCLGQTLHCLEDFAANSNYCELALIDLGYTDVFPHCGQSSHINLQGRKVYPLVTGTLGNANFLRYIVTEVEALDEALEKAEEEAESYMGLYKILSQLSRAGMESGELEKAYAIESKSQKRAKEWNEARQRSSDKSKHPSIQDVIEAIRPILEMGDSMAKVTQTWPSGKLREGLDEGRTILLLGLIAPLLRPILGDIQDALRYGSSDIIVSDDEHRFDPWQDSKCTDPTHSMISKDAVTNMLNVCAGRVAATLVQYAVPRIIYAWENPGVPVDEVANDILRCLHHPAIRDERIESQRDMYATVRCWADSYMKRSRVKESLSPSLVKKGRNHIRTVRSGEQTVDFWKDFWRGKADRSRDDATLNRLWRHVENRYDVRHDVYIRKCVLQNAGMAGRGLVSTFTDTKPARSDHLATHLRVVPIVEAPSQPLSVLETMGRDKPGSPISEKMENQLEEIPTLFSKMEMEKKAIVTQQEKDQRANQEQFWSLVQRFNKAHMPQRPAIVDDDTLASWRTRPTKIALIDTGVSLEDPVIRGHMGRFAGKSWVDENENDYNDVCGHGTHLARLILKVSSTAHILVAKVSRDKKFTAASVINIVEAIRWAVREQASIISLSLGFQAEIPEIREALVEAIRPQDPKRSPIVVVAAAANWAGQAQIAFPASEPHVICINALDGAGESGWLNPEPKPTKRTATLGVAIESRWKGETVWLSGTSFATPIAAGIAANVLEFAKQRMPDMNEWEWRNLSSFRGMSDVFNLMSSRASGGRFSFLAPWRLEEKGVRTDEDIASHVHDVLSMGYSGYLAYTTRITTAYVTGA